MESFPLRGRIYRAKGTSWEAVVIFIAVSASMLFIFWLGPFFDMVDPNPRGRTISFVFFLIGVLLALKNYKTEIRFTEETVELRTLTARKILPLNAIRGRLEYIVRGGEEGDMHRIKLESGDDRFPTLDFERNLAFDDAFWRWFYKLPGLDIENKKNKKNSNFGLA